MNTLMAVMPAQAGIHLLWDKKRRWMPAFLAPQSQARPCAFPMFAGMTAFGLLAAS
jgi:hypothetical protein